MMPLKFSWKYLVILLGLLSLTPGIQAKEDTSFTFVGVALDAETQQADNRLLEYFREKQPLRFETRNMEYGAAIQTLVNWNSAEHGPVLARVTPYVYVVAEMLGADLEIAATYLSKKTENRTYNSYFVIRRDAFAGADLDSFVQYLRQRSSPAKFIYHNKFSTSSYFLPSLYFRKQEIFSVPGQTDNKRNFITIHAEKPEGVGGSSDLVRKVKAGQADFAAVWDGTKSKFENDPELLFLKLPNLLPNDLLVHSPDIPETLKEGMKEAINTMQVEDINIGDFLKWEDFNKTHQARRALASLRWLSRVPPNPVPVKIRKAHKDDSGIEAQYLEAARQAIRLSGTEFVLFDEDFHKQFDVLWTVTKTHDDAVVITSELIDSGLPPQEFHISFKKDNLESLTLRIGNDIINHMHRIRYVWPFDTQAPRVLRDVEFDIPEGNRMKGMKITWNDPISNDYVIGKAFDVSVEHSDFHSFIFSAEGFPKENEEFRFDPMSNTAYRMYLVRPKPRGRMYRIFTMGILGLFGMAAVFALRAGLKPHKT